MGKRTTWIRFQNLETVKDKALKLANEMDHQGVCH